MVEKNQWLSFMLHIQSRCTPKLAARTSTRTLFRRIVSIFAKINPLWPCLLNFLWTAKGRPPLVSSKASFLLYIQHLVFFNGLCTLYHPTSSYLSQYPIETSIETFGFVTLEKKNNYQEKEKCYQRVTIDFLSSATTCYLCVSTIKTTTNNNNQASNDEQNNNVIKNTYSTFIAIHSLYSRTKYLWAKE